MLPSECSRTIVYSLNHLFKVDSKYSRVFRSVSATRPFGVTGIRFKRGEGRGRTTPGCTALKRQVFRTTELRQLTAPFKANKSTLIQWPSLSIDVITQAQRKIKEYRQS